MPPLNLLPSVLKKELLLISVFCYLIYVLFYFMSLHDFCSGGSAVG